ncbi:MAG: hypothetical protein MUE55_08485, partial [Thermoplasmata archaeon]|nr:hypothetical protein [Thermoplasmata archaeon]
LLAKGVDCGVLLPVTSKRQNYYFLNSDLRIEPAPVRDFTEDEDEVALNVFLDRTFAHTPGQAVLPAWGTAADHTILPVPYIDSPKTFVLWLGWLITPTRRKVLSYIGHHGEVTRPQLRKDLGFWADRIVSKEGIPSGVLETADGKIRYQFSNFSFSKLKVKKEEEPDKRRPWTTYPPSFWMTRSYEPIRCIMGASRYLGDSKPNATPAAILEELAKGEITVVDKNRKEFLEVNFLERMSFYAIYHSSGDAAVKISAETLVPEKVTFNSPEHPMLWIMRTDEEHAGARLQFKDEAAKMLLSKKTKEEQVAFLEKMLLGLAMERIGKRLEVHEAVLAGNLDKLRMESFGLGAESLGAVAGLENEREEVLREKMYFEKFMNIMIPGSIKKPKKRTPEEDISEIDKQQGTASD